MFIVKRLLIILGFVTFLLLTFVGCNSVCLFNSPTVVVSNEIFLKATKNIKKNLTKIKNVGSFQIVKPLPKKQKINVANKVKRKKLQKIAKIKPVEAKKIIEIKKIKIRMEINNSELIQHYGFKNIKLEKSNWLSMLKMITKEKIIDKVAVAQASPQKKKIPKLSSHKLSIKTNSIKIFLKEQKERPLISNRVMATINRVMNSSKLDIATKVTMKRNKPKPVDIRSVQKPDYSKLVPTKKNDIFDKVVTTQSASRNNEKKEESNDYSNMNESTMEKKSSMDSQQNVVQSELWNVFDGPASSHKEVGKSKKLISESVNRVIKRETKSVVKVPRTKKNKAKLFKADDQLIALADNAYSASGSRGGDGRNSDPDGATHKLYAINAVFGSGMERTLANFDFVPAHNKNELLDDSGNGVIEIHTKMNGAMSIFSGVINRKGKIPTHVDLVMNREEGGVDNHVPLVDIHSYEKFLEKNNLDGAGGHILIDISDEVKFVDIDESYEARIFLNEQLKRVDIDEDYRYVLYVGVVPGNILLSFKTTDGKTSRKEIHIVQDEIYFEASMFVSEKLERLTFVEKNILGAGRPELVIDSGKISFYETDVKVKIAGPGLYEYKRPKLPLGTRQYLRLSHLQSPIYFGIWGVKTAEVPSNDFIVEIFNFHEIEELDGRCMVQVNLGKSAVEFQADGSTNQGPMSMKITQLDRNGVFSEGDEDITENVSKVFLLGDMTGVINIKVKYVDDSIDYLQTYCAKDTYLVEQL